MQIYSPGPGLWPVAPFAYNEPVLHGWMAPKGGQRSIAPSWRFLQPQNRAPDQHPGGGFCFLSIDFYDLTIAASLWYHHASAPALSRGSVLIREISRAPKTKAQPVWFRIPGGKKKKLINRRTMRTTMKSVEVLRRHKPIGANVSVLFDTFMASWPCLVPPAVYHWAFHAGCIVNGWKD